MRCQSAQYISRISIHVPREGDDVGLSVVKNGLTISIHVPREGDDRWSSSYVRVTNISIHVPREGDDNSGGIASV